MIVTGSVAAGYDSAYIFRGANLGKHAPWAEVDFMAPLGDYSINAGAWYVNPTKPDGGILGDDNDELDLYLTGTTTLGVIDLRIGYTAYLYPEAGGGSTNEVSIGAGASINFVDFFAAYYRDFDLHTNYFEYSIGKNIDLNEFTSLNLGFVLGHVSTRNLHGVLSGGLDFALTDAATLSTYIAWNFVNREKAATGFENKLFGGASLSVEAHEQGAAAGILAAANTIGPVLGPVVGPMLYEISPNMPMLAGAALFTALSFYTLTIKIPEQSAV